MVNKKLGMAVAGAFALCGASAAHAFNVKAGDWDLSMSGEVNAFYTYAQCQNNAVTIAGGTTCTTTFGNGASAVESGLLPSAIVFSAKTVQEGFDIGVTFGFYPGINNGGQVSGANTNAAALAQPSALGSTGIDMRQNFFTFGDKEMGTIKMGRDLGLFGSDAILSDMTLLGVGTPQAPANPGNTTLGRIGIGYVYADWIPQITYITPSFSGFQVSAGVFTPLNMLGGVTLANHSMPMIQAKATYDFNVTDVKGRLWLGGVEQRATGATVASNNIGATALGGELGAKASAYGFDGVVYAYMGRGLGTTGLFLNGLDAAGNKRNSNGGYAQLQYAVGKWKPGISYGFSRLAAGPADGPGGAANRTLVNFNRSAVGQLQYSLTKSLTLLGEYAYSWSTSQQVAPGATTNKNKENSISVGGILFF